MAVALSAYKVDSDGVIRVRHTFYAKTEVEADRLLKQHAGICPAFGPAVQAEETIEILEEDVPMPDAEALEQFEDGGEEDEDDDPEEEEEGDDD